MPEAWDWDRLSGPQCHVYLVPESIYRKRPWRCTGFSVGPTFITLDQMVDALNFKLDKIVPGGFIEYVVMGC